jgi:PEP-CTERM motif
MAAVPEPATWIVAMASLPAMAIFHRRFWRRSGKPS